MQSKEPTHGTSEQPVYPWRATLLHHLVQFHLLFDVGRGGLRHKHDACGGIIRGGVEYSAQRSSHGHLAAKLSRACEHDGSTLVTDRLTVLAAAHGGTESNEVRARRRRTSLQVF
jgi:hypothetical protein